MTGIEIALVKFRNQLNRLFPSGNKRPFASAIITAAGSGTRMGGVSKQRFLLAGKPCLLYSLQAFENCEGIDEIIITAKSGEEEEILALCQANSISKLSMVVTGGQTRQESVKNGFIHIHHDAELVAIHDAARPLIEPTQIQILLDAAKRYGASCAAAKMVDTVKMGNTQNMIEKTIPREGLFTVQTPQVFKSDLYRVSLALAEKDGIAVTDDCSLAEHAGFPIKLCLISSCNLKLTNPEDARILSTLLEDRKNG